MNKKKIRQLLLEHKSIGEISKLCDVSQPTVIKIRDSMIMEGFDVTPPKKRIDLECKKEIVWLIVSTKLSFRDIAERIDCNVKTVYEISQKYNLRSDRTYENKEVSRILAANRWDELRKVVLNATRGCTIHIVKGGA